MLSDATILDISSWDGTISPSEFIAAAHAFAEKWKLRCRGLPIWSWICCRKTPFISSHEVDGYLSLEKLCILRSDKMEDHGIDDAGKEGLNCSENEECTDSAVLVHESCLEVHYYDLHVVYSSSYRVPVIYFRGYRSDGQPLVMDDIEKDIPANSAKVLMESKWTFMTEQEHPYLKWPWYTLHPCGTNEFMRLLFLIDVSLLEDRVAAEQYLTSWLSVVGQVAGLKVPLQMVDSTPPLTTS
ncbi:hypothetical protein Nepgr_004263 [Nepenthes gracilis]|uniref:Ubiquitin-like-conjugating enzyme ATG10 n=1 Tax=Nepenthes gracilis TaxID=150966 RepID=A0AAD3S1B2_NEPGR|nr:hypothetical protein Nepgr_004263 [Nepenthes gracilis]